MASNNNSFLRDFQVLRVIGVGSFAKVYMVKHSVDDKIYAMKAISKDQLDSQKSNVDKLHK